MDQCSAININALDLNAAMSFLVHGIPTSTGAPLLDGQRKTSRVFNVHIRRLY